MLEKPITELRLQDLQRLYTEGEECDKRIFAEMRTNLQLVAGEHYVREGSRFWNRIRDAKQLTSDQRIKLTKNHIQRGTKIYRNAIESHAPGVAIVAANDKELQDQKAAEINYAYWRYIHRCSNLPSQISTWIKNFVEIGEVCVKIFWEQGSGQVIGYEALQAPHPDTGEMQVVTDPTTGAPVPSDTPAYSGKIKIETFEAYNLRRDPAARTMEESPYLIYSKMIPKSAVKTMIKDEEAQARFMNYPTQEHTVYDNNTGQYTNVKNQVLVKEVYFRPAPLIPNGYYYIYIDTEILAQGELPYGIYPIVHEGFDEQTGNPRSHSVIRHARPVQVEINRCASKIAEHQATLADDKVWISANTKVSQGAMLPGIRVNTYSGMMPQVTPGRSGDQYFEYLSAQIDELYTLMNLKEVVEEQQPTADAFSNLFQSFKFRQKFQIYGSKFERFLTRVAETALDISRRSCSEYEVVMAVGRTEQINISEFKNTSPLHYQIQLEPRTDDIESQFGKQLVLNHFIQYTGSQLDKEDVGRLARLSPFLNKEKGFEDLTSNYDIAVNDILALDRGKYRAPRKYEDHKYLIKALTRRTLQGDFEFLSPIIQQLYDQKIQAHEMQEAQNLKDIQEAQAGFIPSGGYLVACDFYQSDPSNPNKTKRVRIPSEAVNWLIDKLRNQGSEIQELFNMPEGAVAEMGQLVNQNNSMLGAVSPQQPA